MRGYSGIATKWVDFVRAGSTQRKREEPCPKEEITESWMVSQENLKKKVTAAALPGQLVGIFNSNPIEAIVAQQRASGRV